MHRKIFSLALALLLLGVAASSHAWMRINEGALELDDIHIRLSSAGTATVTAKTCDQCGEVSVLIDADTRVTGADGKPAPKALVVGYTGGATIMYNFKTLRATQVVLWQ